MTLYQLNQQVSQTFCLISFMPPAHTGFPPAPLCVVLPMNLNLVPKQLPSIILAATASSAPASHFSPLKKYFFPPCCDGIASLACLGNDFSAGLWTWCFPQVEGRIGCVRLCPYPRYVCARARCMSFCVRDLVAWMVGSSKSISLWDNVWALWDLSHLSHAFYVLQSMSPISKAVLLPDKENKKKTWLPNRNSLQSFGI